MTENVISRVSVEANSPVETGCLLSATPVG
jgi:hypothetical protein